jgi:hypothetical protein
MDAIIGRYKLRMDETGLVLKHPTGIIIDLRPNEVLGLWRFIDFYREQLSDMQRDTRPQLETTDTEELIDHKNRWRDK